MKFLNSKTAELLADALCSTLLGTAVCILLFPALGMDIGWGECLLIMLADMALVALCSRKWWILPSFLGCAALLTVIVSSLLETNDLVVSYISGFFQWCANGYPDTLPYSLNGSMIIVHLAYALPVACLIFLYFRKLFFFYVLPPAVMAMLISAVLSKSSALWPILIVLLFVLFVALAKMRGNKISNHETKSITSAMLSISAIMIMPVLLCIVFVISPEKDGDWKCKPLVNAVQDIGDFLGINRHQSPSDSSFHMGLTGFSPLESRLGGDITINNDIALRVKTGTPVRLTGAVFDTYDGTKWYDSFSRQRYRFQSIFVDTQKAEAFSLKKPSGSPQIQKLFDEITMPSELEISSSLKGRTLFFAGQVASIISDKPDTSDIFFNNQSELFTLEPHRKFTYTLNTVVFDRSATDFNMNLLALEELTAKSPDPALDGIKAEYLPLPDSLPQSVYDTTLKITSDCETPYEKALAIESWLSGHCEYTLTPGSPPEGEDFVASFLQERQGYCVYFASAMTVMSRCAGLPARYVIGFGLKRSPFSKAINSYVATNAMAHAWTEIYFQGIGWVPFDATSWNFNEDAIVDTAQPSSAYLPPVPSPVSAMELNQDMEYVQTGSMSQALKIILIVLASLIGLLVLFILIRFLLLQEHGNGSKLYRKYASNSDRMDACYRKILYQAASLNVNQLPSDTITSFAQRVDTRLGSHAMTVVCAPIIRMRFGQEKPIDEDVHRLCAFSEALEKRLRRELGLCRYIWARVIKLRRLP